MTEMINAAREAKTRNRWKYKDEEWLHRRGSTVRGKRSILDSDKGNANGGWYTGNMEKNGDSVGSINYSKIELATSVSRERGRRSAPRESAVQGSERC